MIKPYFYFVALLLHIAPIVGLEINGYTIGPNASLSNANLSKAILRDCNLNEAILENANLSDADVTRASMVYALLHGTNIRPRFCRDLRLLNLDAISMQGKFLEILPEVLQELG